MFADRGDVAVDEKTARSGNFNRKSTGVDGLVDRRCDKFSTEPVENLWAGAARRG
jgi:hypothetical protein